MGKIFSNTNKRMYSSVRMIPISFFAAILLGAVILTLPVASESGQWTSFVDALFTATTSVCVTGLTVLDTGGYWSYFGQFVIFVLIQIGGLGIIAVMSLLMIFTQKRFSLSDRMMLRDSLNLDTTSGVLRFLMRIICATFLTELAGTILYAFVYIPKFGVAKGLWYSLFQAVSAFCNAGMDVMGGDSLAAFHDNAAVLIITMLLIVIGSGGFVVWFDIANKVKHGRIRRFTISQIVSRFSEHTKLALTMTIMLIVGGAGVIFFAEYSNPDTIGNMSMGDKILNSFFESITFRTAGFSSFSQAGLTDVSCAFAYLIMFIGGSPVGTAGGVKTTTFYLAVKNVTSYIRGEESTIVFHKAVSAEHMRKATVIVSVSLVTVIGLTLLLLATNPVEVEDGLFEIVSASATVGLTKDVTPTLNVAGKLIVTAGMYLGRIGPISMAIFLADGNRKKEIPKHPDGKFFIG